MNGLPPLQKDSMSILLGYSFSVSFFTFIFLLYFSFLCLIFSIFKVSLRSAFQIKVEMDFSFDSSFLDQTTLDPSPQYVLLVIQTWL